MGRVELVTDPACSTTWFGSRLRVQFPEDAVLGHFVGNLYFHFGKFAKCNQNTLRIKVWCSSWRKFSAVRLRACPHTTTVENGLLILWGRGVQPTALCTRESV